MLEFMLGTNICISTIKNRPQEVREASLRHHDQICISTVTLMELIYGAEKSSNPSRNLIDVEGFAARLEVLKYDQKTVAHTGQLRVKLACLGK